MRRLVPLSLLAVAAAGCGGTHTLSPANTGSRPVTKPLQRAVVVRLQGTMAGTAQLRSVQGQKTSVSVRVPRGAAKLSVELDRGSCAKATELHTPTVLGTLSSSHATWTMPTPLAQLTAAPVAVVVRSATHAVAACGNVRSG